MTQLHNTLFFAATSAQLQLDIIVNNHNKETRHERHALKIKEDTEPFLWGQDFDIEPDVWDDFDKGYA